MSNLQPNQTEVWVRWGFMTCVWLLNWGMGREAVWWDQNLNLWGLH